MSLDEVGWGSGHVFRVERHQGPVWYAKYRLPDGRQVKKKIGPAWTGRGRPAAGYVTKRGAEQWLREVLDAARERAQAGALGVDATFADAAREWLRYVEHDRACKPSTMLAYRSSVSSRLLPAFGEMKLHEITPAQIERWRAGLPVSPRMKNKLLVELHGIFPAGAEGLRAVAQSGGRGRAAAGAPAGRRRGVLAGGGLRACARRGVRAGRSDPPDRGVHRTAAR